MVKASFLCDNSRNTKPIKRHSRGWMGGVLHGPIMIDRCLSLIGAVTTDYDDLLNFLKSSSSPHHPQSPPTHHSPSNYFNYFYNSHNNQFIQSAPPDKHLIERQIKRKQQQKCFSICVGVSTYRKISLIAFLFKFLFVIFLLSFHNKIRS